MLIEKYKGFRIETYPYHAKYKIAVRKGKEPPMIFETIEQAKAQIDNEQP